MSLERLGIILPTSSLYDVLQTFARQLQAALVTKPGIQAFLIESRPGDPNFFFEQLQRHRIQALVIFNGYFAPPHLPLLCDLVALPTVFCLVDAPYHFTSRPSDYAIIACVDRRHRQFLEQRDYLRTLDLPHAIDAAQHAPPEGPRPQACAMFSSAIDPAAYSTSWHSLLPLPLYTALHEAAEELLTESEADLSTVFTARLEAHRSSLAPQQLQNLSLYSLLQQLDLYVKGRGRLALLQGLAPLPIDLYGQGWAPLLGTSYPHVTLHDPLPYSAILEQMRRTKVVLSNCESIRDGSHERILAALSHGAAVATADTPFLRETFSSNDGILFYQAPHWSSLRQAVIDTLNNESQRCQAVQRGQQCIQDHHLWQHRANTILQALEQWAHVLPFRDPAE